MGAWWRRMQAVWAARGGYAAVLFVAQTASVILWRRPVLAAYVLSTGVAAIVGMWWVGPLVVTVALTVIVVVDAGMSGGQWVRSLRSRVRSRSRRIGVWWTWPTAMADLGLVVSNGRREVVVPRLKSVTMTADSASPVIASGMKAGFRWAVGKVEATESDLALRIGLPPGAIHADWVKNSERMRSWWGCRRVRVDEIDSQTVDVRLFFGNPLAKGMPLADFRNLLAAPHSLDSLPVGIDEDGAVKILNMTSPPHWLIAGTTDSGKSSVLQAMMLAAVTSDEGVNLVLLDPKIVEMQAWKPIATAHATTPDDVMGTLEGVIELMNARFEYMAKVGVKGLWDKGQNGELINSFHIQVLGGPVWVVIDEVAMLLEARGKKVGVSITGLVSLARGAGIHVLTATQRPSAALFEKAVGMDAFKPNVSGRLALRTQSRTESDVILASGTERQEADASKIPITMPGTVIGVNGALWRAPHVDTTFVESVIAGMSHMTMSELLAAARGGDEKLCLAK